MGPRLISRGDLVSRVFHHKTLKASMGPRLISRGDEGEGNTFNELVQLQWGRG